MSFKLWIHKAIIALRCEPLFIFLGKQIHFFARFIPDHTLYNEKTIRKIIRGGAVFSVDVSDYMQWLLFINAKDILPAIAMRYVHSDSIVLDIGANVGHFSLKVAKLISLVRNFENVELHAMEPNPYVFRKLQDNLDLNTELKGKVHLHQLAIGAADGEADFVFGNRNSGAGRFMLLNEKPHTRVGVRSLDNFCLDNLLNKGISFIKIDVEGFEPEVITGAEQTIKKHKPVLFFEFSPVWCKQRGVDLFASLQQLSGWGYRFYFEKDGEMIKVSGDFEELRSVYQTNILAIQKEAQFD